MPNVILHLQWKMWIHFLKFFFWVEGGIFRIILYVRHIYASTCYMSGSTLICIGVKCLTWDVIIIAKNEAYFLKNIFPRVSYRSQGPLKCRLRNTVTSKDILPTCVCRERSHLEQHGKQYPADACGVFKHPIFTVSCPCKCVRNFLYHLVRRLSETPFFSLRFMLFFFFFLSFLDPDFKNNLPLAKKSEEMAA